MKRRSGKGSRRGKKQKPTRRKSRPEPKPRVQAVARRNKRAAAPAEPSQKVVRSLQSARRRLERQLIAAVQEIGLLRQFEKRAAALETEVARRDAEIVRLRGELDVRLGGASIVST
jgi:hypothetical protein